MARLCGRPGCSELGAVAYGMVPEDLLFWIAPLADAPVGETSVLCERHADAMVVPMGWILDDRRQSALRLFTTRSQTGRASSRPKSRQRRSGERHPEQLQIDGTDEIARPDVAPDEQTDEQPDEQPDRHDVDGRDSEVSHDASPTGEESSDPPSGQTRDWKPSFDTDDDLDGLLEVKSPLLARAFHGADRRRP